MGNWLLVNVVTCLISMPSLMILRVRYLIYKLNYYIFDLISKIMLGLENEIVNNLVEGGTGIDGIFFFKFWRL